MSRYTLLPLLFVCFWETTAQQIVPFPSARATLHTNRMRVQGIQAGLIAWQLKPDVTDPVVKFAEPPFAVDFDGNPMPCAGVERAGLWIGGKDTTGQVRVSCEGLLYNKHAFTPGPLSGHCPTDSLNALNWDRFFSVSRLELEMHRADWADNGVLDNPLPAILGWPGSGNPYFAAQTGFPLPKIELAPFVDVNNDNIYNPFDGDYPHPPALDPDVLPGQILWNIFNDVSGDVTSLPLGVEVRSTAWALACDGDNLLNETVFFSYQITNRSGNTLDSVAVALWANPQIGALTDDAVGTMADLNTMFAYNRNNPDTNQHTTNPNIFGVNPPATALTYLNRPLYKGMMHYIIELCDPYFPLLEPSTPEQYFHNLHGQWRDGSPLVYGGDGYGQGLPTDHAFPGDPNDPTAWTMLSDYQSCGFMAGLVPSMYVGHFPSGATFSFDAAYTYHRDPGLNNLQNVAYGFDRIAQLQALYDGQFAGACTYSACTDDCVWPGDLDRDGSVQLRDILPLGAGWAATGKKRPGPVTWAPHSALNWDVPLNNTYDFKHLDANGDGVLDALDISVIQAFKGYKTPVYSAPDDEYRAGDELWLWQHSISTAKQDNVQPQKTAYVRLHINAPDVFGVAYQVEIDTNYWNIVQSAATGMPQGLRLLDVSGGIFDAAAVFMDNAQTFEPNRVYFLANLRSKTIADTLPDTTFIRVKNIRGIRSDGSEVLLGSNELRYCFGGDCPPYVGTDEPRREAVAVFPNPASRRVTLHAPNLTWQRIEAFDLNGRLLRYWDEPGSDLAELHLDGIPAGWVVLRVAGQDWVGMIRVLRTQ